MLMADGVPSIKVLSGSHMELLNKPHTFVAWLMN